MANTRKPTQREKTATSKGATSRKRSQPSKKAATVQKAKRSTGNKQATLTSADHLEVAKEDAIDLVRASVGMLPVVGPVAGAYELFRSLAKFSRSALRTADTYLTEQEAEEVATIRRRNTARSAEQRFATRQAVTKKNRLPSRRS